MSRTRIEGLIASGGLRTVFHPVVRLVSRDIIGFEALSRFPDEGERPPSAWFAEAVEAGMRSELEAAAIATAVRSSWPLPAHAFVALNGSPRTVVEGELRKLVGPLRLDRVVLDIAEDAAVDEYPEFGPAIEALRRDGLRIALDDTGAGFVSLRHVVGVRPDYIKIGLEVTRGIDKDVANQAFASALCAVAARIGAVTIAEGIETDSELVMLASLGVYAGQGYLFGMPASAETFAA
jgi:EAL domain-containing protein (putative c-di-GMP-specific phosphodiesterase class I)